MPDPEQAIAGYEQLFDVKRQHLPEFEFSFLQIGAAGVEFLRAAGVEFLRADEKNQLGVNGQVAYGWVGDVDAFVARAKQYGARLYRGPIDIEEGKGMAQLLEPFGNLIGARGSKSL